MNKDHCPGCRGYHMPVGTMQPFPKCPGIHTAELESLFSERDDLRRDVERLTAERDDMMRVYRVEHERHTATLEQRDTLCADVARLRDAAAGRGMVSEQADVQDVAILVVGLHAKVARLEKEIVQMAGEVCSAAGINAPGEDAVTNWHNVLEKVVELRQPKRARSDGGRI